MKSHKLQSKQFALKILLLNQAQREIIFKQIGEFSSDIQLCVNELQENFPLLGRLNTAQRKAIYENLAANGSQSEWEHLEQRMLDFNSATNQLPSKLYTIIFEHRD